MRLSLAERAIIKQLVARHDSEAKVKLFGSRVDDTQRGGDIDLLIESFSLNREKLRALRLELEDNLGEQKIDIVLLGEDPTAFACAIAEDAIPL
jgi:uncharacterized protein